MERRFLAIVIAVVLVLGSVLYIYWRIPEPMSDPLQLRAANRALLERHALVLRAWRDAREDWPEDLRAMRDFSRQLPDADRLMFGSELAPGVGVYRYRPPPDPDPATVVMAAAQGLPAVSAGTVLADGTVLEQDLPAAYFVLRADLEVEVLDAEARRQRVAVPGGDAP